ncbi:hypothetical protein [Paenibacillus apis]|nr:hypothetical protein [Paenibacillus apis]
MSKETVSFGLWLGGTSIFPESGFFLLDEMKEGALSSSYDDFWDTLF